MTNRHTVEYKGRTYTRNSKTRTYTHAIAADGWGDEDRAGVLSWAGSEELARKAVADFTRKGYRNVHALPVACG